MQNNQTTIRLVQSCETDHAISPQIGRITGLMNAENFFKLMTVLGVESNPRKPKESNVTKEIIGTLNDSPDLFHLMSKGVLVSVSRCESLERNRFKLNFDQNGYALPGILDGGHNVFAIAKHLLSFSLSDTELRLVKDWESLQPVWQANEELLADLFKPNDENHLEFDFLIPIEIIFPRQPEDVEALNYWGESHRDITHARNNNAQLTDATKDNHQGFYDYLKNVMPSYIRDNVEWKTNDGGVIKAADIVALALIPLSRLPKEVTGTDINLVKIYNSKQYCVEIFRQILEKEGNGQWKGQTYELTNNLIKSALDLVPDVIETYDHIYKNFPNAYNAAGGSFGRISGVRIYDEGRVPDQKYSKKPFATKFTSNECDYNYADGFIIPVVVALRELMSFSREETKLVWQYQPKIFLTDNFPKILGMYSTIIRATNFDPNKIGKDKGSYEIVSGAIQLAANTTRY